MSGYESFVVLNIINHNDTNSSIKIMNGNLKYGKFHENENKNNDIPTNHINNITVWPNSALGISACGKFDSTDGTEGSIELYEGQTKICKLFWRDGSSGGNDFQIQDYEFGGKYQVGVGNWNRYEGGIGTVDVEVVKRG